MATPPVSSVNPIQATSDPEYTSYRWSRPIAPIEGNKAAETGIQGGANLLREGVDAGDSLIKNTLTNNIEDQAGSVRDKYSNELQTTLSALRGGQLKGADAMADASTDPQGKMDLLSKDGSKPAVPNDLKNLEGTLSKLEAVKANGKQTPSQVDAQYDALAKQYRARWPGYREYIDSTFDRVTQRGPANQLIRSQVAELDAYAAAAKEKSSKVESLLQHAQEVDHIPGSNQWEADYKAGRLSEAGVRQKYNTVMSREFTLKRDKDEWEGEKIGTERKSALAEKVVNGSISNTIDSFVDTMGDSVGYNLDKIHADIASNNPEIKGHAEQLATQIEAFKAQAISKATQEAMQVRNGSSVYRDLGPEKFKKLIEDQPKIRDLNSTISLLNSKDNGLATISMRMQHEEVNNKTWQLLSENTAMSKALFGMEVSKGLGDAANSKILQDALGKGGALNDYPMWFQKNIVLGATQPNENDPKVPPEDKYITLKHTIEEAQLNKVNDPVSFRRLFNTTVDNITDPKTPEKFKEGYMNFAFAPQNLGILEKIEPDHTDPATGKKIPGKVWLYNQFTSDKVAKAVSGMRNPDLYTKYQDFVSQEGQHIVGQEVPKLNSLLDNPNVKISYNDVTHQFKLEGQNPNSVPPQARQPGGMGEGARNLLNKIEAFKVFGRKGESNLSGQDSVDKINSVLKAVGTMAQYSPDKPDPNEYALRMLEAMAPPGSVGEKMVKAIISTAPKPKAEPK